jgi:hypothetical protein
MRRTGGSVAVFKLGTGPAPTALQPTGIVSASVLPLFDEIDDIRTFRMAGPTGPGLELAGRVCHVDGGLTRRPVGAKPDHLADPAGVRSTDSHCPRRGCPGAAAGTGAERSRGHPPRIRVNFSRPYPGNGAPNRNLKRRTKVRRRQEC